MGNSQHDTMEFLNYLLDGLHEDLNKVLEKPGVEKDESKKKDKVKSLEEWYSFLLRNQSILVDLFFGQFKSTLHCPDSDCQNIQTSFDPFMSIALPIAHKVQLYEVVCFFIFFNLEITALQLIIPFTTECVIMALRHKVASILDIHPYSFFMVNEVST